MVSKVYGFYKNYDVSIKVRALKPEYRHLTPQAIQHVVD